MQRYLDNGGQASAKDFSLLEKAGFVIKSKSYLRSSDDVTSPETNQSKKDTGNGSLATAESCSTKLIANYTDGLLVLLCIENYTHLDEKGNIVQRSLKSRWR